MQQKRRYIIPYVVLGSLAYFLLPQDAYAYIDPGTGIYFVQMIIAALLGGLLALKIFWSKIKFFLQNLFSKKRSGK